MANLAKLVVRLEAQSAQLLSELDKANRRIERFDRQTSATLKRWSANVKRTFAAIGVGLVLRQMTRETASAEHALAQLGAALKSTGNAAGYSKDQLVEMSDRLAESTTHTATEITEAQTRLLSYSTIVGEQYPRALQLAIDQSVRLGESITQSAETIGRALETPSRGVASLTKQGFVFTQQQRSLLRSLEQSGRLAEAQAIVMDVLEESYAGAGYTARNTFGGALDAVKESLSDLVTAKDGLPGATAALNDFAKTLKDPALKQAADSVLGSVAWYVSLVTKGLVGWGYRFGLAGDAFVKLDRQIEMVQNRIEAMERRSSGATPGWLNWLTQGDSSEKLAKLRRELAGLMQQQQKMMDEMGRSSSGPAEVVPIVAPPSEAFLKLEAQLQKQIALYGKVGEAAKLAYAFQADEIEDLSGSEQKRLLQLAQQYDAMVRAATAADEQAAAQKKLQDAYDSQVDSYQRQIAMSGELTELERLRYEIASGAMRGIDEQQQRILEGLASEIDAHERRAALLDEVQDIWNSTRTPLEEYEQTIARLNELLNESHDALGDGALDYETYARAVKQAQDRLEEASGKMTDFASQMRRNTQDILGQGLVDIVERSSSNILQVFTSMITRLVAQAIAADLAGKLFGTEGSGGGGGLVGAAMGYLGGAFGRGGSRDRGGRGQPGVAYSIGRGAQPEVYVPDQPGTFYPRGEMGGVGQVTQNISVAGRLDIRTARQLQIEAARQQRIATSRLG